MKLKATGWANRHPSRVHVEPRIPLSTSAQAAAAKKGAQTRRFVPHLIGESQVEVESRQEPAKFNQIARRRRENGAVEIGPFEVGIVSAGIGFKLTDDSGTVPQLPEAHPPLPQLPVAQPPVLQELQVTGQTVSGTSLQTS